MKTIFRATALSGLLVLSACENSFGPVSLKLEPESSFALLNKKKQTLSLSADQSYDSIVKYNSSRKKAVVEIGGVEFVFNKALLNEADGSINSAPEVSKVTLADGSGVGLSMDRNLVCNPTCEQKEIRRFERSCTFWERRPVTFCYNTGKGTVCQTTWESFLRSGWEEVEETRVTRSYDYLGTLSNVDGETLASVSGQNTEISRSQRVLWGCRP